MRFELVDKEIYKRDFITCYEKYNLNKVIDQLGEKMVDNEFRAEALAARCYFDLKKPVRKTIGSAGYDFTFPMTLRIDEGVTVRIPTGICWNAHEGGEHYVLMLYPRSSLGISHSLREPNLVSIIDSDYYGNPKNGGHIMVNLRNEGHNGPCVIHPSSGYIQGIVTRYFLMEDDNVTETRIGGFGSTDIRSK